MGCLTAAIYTAFLYDIDSSIVNENTGLEVSVEKNYSSLEAILETNGGIGVQIVNYNTGVNLGFNCVPQTLQFELSLVCEISPGQYELLRVYEGNIITIDGQYIRVLRNGV